MHSSSFVMTPSTDRRISDKNATRHSHYLFVKLQKGQVVKYRFSYNNIDKPVNAMFIGTPPEFDMAVYTICFMVKPNRGCPVSFANMKFIIRTHTFKYRGKRLIGSAFPEI